MLASAVMSAAGSVAGGMHAKGQANYQAGISRNNAMLAHQSGEASEAAGLKERRDFWREVSQVKGQNIAAMAANGIDVGFGSAERMQADTSMLAREDAEAMNKNIASRTRGFVIEGMNHQAESKAQKSKGRAALLSGLFQGATTLIGAAGQYKGLKAKGFGG